MAIHGAVEFDRPRASERLTLHRALRDATRASHHLIDHHPLLAPLVRADLSRRDYARALRAMLHIHLPLQSVLMEAMAQTGGGHELADRVAWLFDDLSVLDDGNITAQPAWQPPPIEGPAALAGVLYVIEGSTMGGQVIARQIEASLGYTATCGARFFNAWGVETIQRWQAFLRYAEALGGADIPSATAAAVTMFNSIHQALDSSLPDEAVLNS